jgi:phosphoglycerol transferase MdoB-like AlkP superfamily enzyme
MLWTGGAIKAPAEVTTYASQCDLAATLLGQLGIDHSQFSFSRDIFDPQSEKFAYWSFNNGFGIINDQGSVIYDCTGNTIADSHNADNTSTQELLRIGKALTQTIHNDICAR